MNRIEACVANSQYSNAPHLNFVVDGVPLQTRLDTVAPHRQLAGLIPTLLDCLYDATDRALVWDRILPQQGNCTHAPILMCPDDCDLWCTVIIAEAYLENQTVWWHRLGIDLTRRDVPADVGTNVEWINGIGPFAFSLSDYQRCIASFRRKDV